MRIPFFEKATHMYVVHHVHVHTAVCNNTPMHFCTCTRNLAHRSLILDLAHHTTPSWPCTHVARLPWLTTHQAEIVKYNTCSLLLNLLYFLSIDVYMYIPYVQFNKVNCYGLPGGQAPPPTEKKKINNNLMVGSLSAVCRR